jgi:hypothetical protein
MIERRGFLKGLFGGVTSAGLIIAATPKEIEAFAAPLVKDAPVTLLQEPPRWRNGPSTTGEILYNDRGEAVAIITDIQATRDIDRYDFGSGWQVAMPGLMPGPLRIDVRAVGIGYIQTSGTNFELRGRK